jgi:hypothetical protein
MARFATKIIVGDTDLAAAVTAVVRATATPPAGYDWRELPSSLGYAVTRPLLPSGDSASVGTTDPHDLVWFIGGWGSEREQHAAEAVHELMAAAKGARDTLAMHQNPNGLFVKPVDYRGGGKFVRSGTSVVLAGADGGDSPRENDFLADVAGGATMMLLDKLQFRI